MWWRSFLGTIGTQLLQALVLLAGLGAFFTPSTPIAVLIGRAGPAGPHRPAGPQQGCPMRDHADEAVPRVGVPPIFAPRTGSFSA